MYRWRERGTVKEKARRECARTVRVPIGGELSRARHTSVIIMDDLRGNLLRKRGEMGLTHL